MCPQAEGRLREEVDETRGYHEAMRDEGAWSEWCVLCCAIWCGGTAFSEVFRGWWRVLENYADCCEAGRQLADGTRLGLWDGCGGDEIDSPILQCRDGLLCIECLGGCAACTFPASPGRCSCPALSCCSGRSCVSRVREGAAGEEVVSRGFSPALCARLSPVLST